MSLLSCASLLFGQGRGECFVAPDLSQEVDNQSCERIGRVLATAASGGPVGSVEFSAQRPRIFPAQPDVVAGEVHHDSKP